MFAKPIPCVQGFYADTVNHVACVRCPAGWKCPTVYAKEECQSGTYSLTGSLNCYPIPSGMKANTVAPTAAKPEWCANDEVSMLGEIVCNQCEANKQCGGDNFAQDDCDVAKLTSRAGEKSCYPYRFTYPTDAGYNAGDGLYTPVTLAVPDDLIMREVHPGEYNYDGGTIDADMDCPVGYQCIWPFM